VILGIQVIRSAEFGDAAELGTLSPQNRGGRLSRLVGVPNAAASPEFRMSPNPDVYPIGNFGYAPRPSLQ